MTVIKAAKVAQGNVSLQRNINKMADNSLVQTKPPAVDKEMLRTLFKDELEALFAQQKDAGFKQGLAEAQALIDQDIAEEKAKLKQQNDNTLAELSAKQQEKNDALASLLQDLKTIHDDLSDKQRQHHKDAEFNLIRLCMECLYQLVGEEKFKNALIEESVKHELANLDLAEIEKIRLSPDTYQALTKVNELTDLATLFEQDTGMPALKFEWQKAHSMRSVDLAARLEQNFLALIDCYHKRND